MGAGGRYKLRIHGVGRAGTSTVFLPCSRRLYLPCVMRKAPIVEAGEYSVCVGASRPDSRSVELMGQAPAKRKVCQIQKAILDL